MTRHFGHSNQPSGDSLSSTSIAHLFINDHHSSHELKPRGAVTFSVSAHRTTTHVTLAPSTPPQSQPPRLHQTLSPPEGAAESCSAPLPYLSAVYHGKEDTRDTCRPVAQLHSRLTPSVGRRTKLMRPGRDLKLLSLVRDGESNRMAMG